MQDQWIKLLYIYIFLDKSAIRFIPRENGVHSIDVKFNGCHIPGSPFNVRVGDPGLIADPGMVTAHGAGLLGGTTGTYHMYIWDTGVLHSVHKHLCQALLLVLLGVPSEFVVNTCNAGSGALSVNIDGPSKVKMDCRECPEGYRITYTPMAPGNYLITIKYGGPQHIVGSPFKAKITGLHDSHSTIWSVDDKCYNETNVPQKKVWKFWKKNYVMCVCAALCSYLTKADSILYYSSVFLSLIIDFF